MRLNLFGFLMPREEAFIDLFCEQSRLVVATAVELRSLIENGHAMEEHFAAIRRLESEADAVARRIILAANNTFNAPIDRENILGLAHDLDDIVDLIEEAAKEIKRYEVRVFPPEMKVMADAITRSAAIIQEALPLLDSLTREHRKISELCQKIGQIEGEADECFDESLTRLRGKARAGEIDVLAYIDRKEILEHLEAVVDKCDDVGNELQTIVAKHV
jgi:predicted phosphate transport protein (TIGR00153 family)